MQLVFIYGQVASGKLTVAQELAELTGWPLFHNHLVVDAVGAVFPFGSEPFVELRESFWLQIIGEAARARTSLIFTFAPEPSVDPAFPERVRQAVAQAGGATRFVALTVDPAEQERRLVDPARSAFGKMRSLELLQSLRGEFDRCLAEMPTPHVAVDTTSIAPRASALKILDSLSG